MIFNWRERLQSFDEIPGGKFEGYYWESNSPKIKFPTPGKIDPSWFKQLPFVVEANFYDSKNEVSISIKNIDGQYHIQLIDINQIVSGREDHATSHPMHIYRRTFQSVVVEKKYYMYEIWDSSESLPFLESMRMLKPACVAFGGFIK